MTRDGGGGQVKRESLSAEAGDPTATVYRAKCDDIADSASLAPLQKKMQAQLLKTALQCMRSCSSKSEIGIDCTCLTASLRLLL